ncbi:MAG: DUF47 family protein [Patescibacteria group bacterium]
MIFFKSHTTIFDEFEKMNVVLLEAGAKLLEVPKSIPEALGECAREVSELQRKANEARHAIADEIDKSFVTPLDREDLHVLVVRLDATLDHAENAVSNLVVYGVKTARDPLAEFCETVNQAIKECVSCVRVLRQHKKLERIRQHFQELHRLEMKGDILLQMALKELFSHEQDVREIMIWKDIFLSFERSLDRGEDVADVLEGILIKNT